ncbi:MAG: hypothetical protein M1816_006331 [Peltula sp. TS41687]|nr:MAG: hypothetical protein M1816_006331 [Peltula sp. TS41687]
MSSSTGGGSSSDDNYPYGSSGDDNYPYGSSGDDGYYSSYSSRYSESPWTIKYRLSGFRFTEPAVSANIVLTCILLFALVFLTLWWITTKLRHDNTRRVFRCVTTLRLVGLFLNDFEATVAGSYLLISVFITLFTYLRDLWFLAIFIIILHRQLQHGLPLNNRILAVFRGLAMPLWIALAVLSIVAFALFTRFDVLYIKNYQKTSYDQIGPARTYRDFETAWVVINLVAAIVILATAATLPPRFREMGHSDRVVTYFFWLVALPHFIRAVVQLAVDIRSNWFIPETLSEVWALLLVPTILVLGPTVVLLAGLIYIARLPVYLPEGRSSTNDPTNMATAEEGANHHNQHTVADLPVDHSLMSQTYAPQEGTRPIHGGNVVR